jgi:thiamine pyridinylase
MFFDYFLSQQWLEPLSANEIDDPADYLPYATAGVQSGGFYYAIPQLGCTNILFYLKSDAQLAAATTLSQVQAALGQCSYTSDIPPDRRGLMLDLAGGTTNAAMYLDAAYSIGGQTPPLPWNQSELNTQAIANVKALLASASYLNATTAPPQAYERGTWFGSGWGRALMDYTEAMSAMSAQTRSQIAFKVMPLSDSSNPPYFFADVIAVNPTSNGRGTRALAVQLANVIAASSTIVASLQATSSSPVPQYLMPTRPSVFAQLGATDPIYQQMAALAMSANPVMFKVSSQSRAWVTAMKGTIRSSVRSQYPCACDFVATQLIWNDGDAPAICTATCADHGGWNGQWTNRYPVAQQSSACGCNTCAP